MRSRDSLYNISNNMNLRETWRNNPKVSNVGNGLTTVLFMIYLIAIGWILLLKLGVRFSYMGKRSVNLVPFSEPSILTSENILNVVIFVPLGIYAGTLFERWIFGKKLLFFFLLCSSVILFVCSYVLCFSPFVVTDFPSVGISRRRRKRSHHGFREHP